MSIILEDSICAVDDIARNEVPQLSKTEATMAKNQNSIGVRYREKTGSVGGASYPLARRNQHGVEQIFRIL